MSSGGLTAIDADTLMASVVERLREAGSPERAEHEKAYLKSDLEFLGASLPCIRSTAVALHQQMPELAHGDLVALVEALWGAGIHELRMTAVELLDLYRDRLSPLDTPFLERLIRQSGTWALVDGLAVSVTGDLTERFPDALHPVLAAWAQDDDVWLRRASLLAYLPGLRRGGGYFERFAALADPMLGDDRFFIRKAIGWVLRETGKKRPERVIEWLEPRLHRASGLTVREAVKRLPERERERLLEARAAR